MNGLGRKTKNEEKREPIFTKETFGVVFILFATLSMVCLITRESVFSLPGKYVNSFLFGCFGYFAYAVVAWFCIIGLRMLFDKKSIFSLKERTFLTLGFLSLSIVVHVATMHGSGLSYGEYVKRAYVMASEGGIATCSGGGFFVSLIAHPFSLLMTEVGCYVVFGIIFAVCIYFFVKSLVNGAKKPARGENELRGSCVKTDNSTIEVENAQDGSVETVKTPKQSLFISNPEDFELKSRHELKKDDGPSMKLGFSAGGLGVVTTTTEEKDAPKISQDYEKKLQYIKTPAVLDLDALRDNSRRSTENVNTYAKPDLSNQNNFSGANTDGYTTVSDYVNVSENKEVLDEKEEDIPFIEHGENFTVEGGDAVERADAFEKKYAQNDEFYAETKSVDDSEVYSPISSTENDSVEIEETPVTQESNDDIPFIEEFPAEEEIEEIKPSILHSDDRARNIFAEDKEETVEMQEEKPVGSSVERTTVDFTSRVSADGNGGVGFGERRRFDFGANTQEQPAPEPEKPKKPAPPINRKYFRPPLDLLETYTPPVNVEQENHEERMEIIKSTLEQFHINAIPQSYVQGPSITRYEIMMPAGITVKKVLQYDDDLRMRLSSREGVRIEAPIPGKNLVGIEVANKVKVSVGLKEVLEGAKDKKGSLIFAIGKDLVGNSITDDLAKGPHYLVAGSTGSGKSVCLNLMLISMIMRYSPEDLRLILVDPKGVEFRPYEHIPHLMIDEIITEPKKALAVLQWCYDEMERRYKEFQSQEGVVDIDSYNEVVASDTVAKMPRIVVVVDELSNLMETCKKEMDARILALAQKARAAGIHLVLATQRPSVDVITGTIKANLPSRIALKLMSFADSNTIISEGGAEKLLGNGDMLYRNSGMNECERYQGAYISRREVNNIVKYIKENNQAYFDDELQEYLDRETRPKQEETAISGGDDEGDANEINEFFLKALWLAVNTQTVSISQLQRRFQIGYSRAGGLVDKMERMGFVSANEGSKARKVLLSREEFENRFGAMPD
ncbi:MAG: hypothetical protein J6U92_07110 [Clostridia bacterium]|nr:hypothetical protein [Clostridia bacterium]